MTGIGDVLGAELLAAIGGSLAGFASADHLAGYAGLAPMPRDSGYRTGNLHRPQRYNRQLQRVFYTSAMISIQRSPASKTFYDGKRAQGKRHTQAVIAAVASYVVPATGNVRNAELTNLATFVGAVCFFIGAILLLPPETATAPVPADRAS